MPRPATSLTAAAFGAAVFCAACNGSVTDPFGLTSEPAPSGLPASFRALSAADSLLGNRASVTASGDSVAVVATGTDVGCGLRVSANAGIVDGALVVTRLASFPPEGVNCLAIARIATPVSLKVVVHSVPSGRYTVVLLERFPAQAGQFRERELTRGDVTLR